MIPIQPFEGFKAGSLALAIQPAKDAPGIGRIAYIRSSSGPMAYVGARDMRVPFPIKPTNLDINKDGLASVKSTSKFDLELAIDGNTMKKFEDACIEVDAWVVQTLYDRRGEFFEEGVITSVEQVQSLYSAGRMLKYGKSSYDNTVKFKIQGWTDYVDTVSTKLATVDGQDKYLAEKCTWKPRPTTNMIRANETKFFLKVGPTSVTTKITDKNGVRMVGPQDCVPGCTVTPVFMPNSVYSNGKMTGITVALKDVYITRPSTGMLDGFNCVDDESMAE